MAIDKHGRLFLISGPSGVGKTTLCDRLLARTRGDGPEVRRVVTCTTRPPRDDEQNGVDYRFFDREEFARREKQGEFLETAEVHGHYYGTPRDQIEGGIKSGEVLLLNVDVQGADTLRKALAAGEIDELTTVFILPPSLEVLRKRLEERRTDSEDVISERLRNAEREMEQKVHYDHQVVNEDLEVAVESLWQIIRQPVKTG